jgi:hydroxymethylglutaryl-CoA reductase (NADPH)
MTSEAVQERVRVPRTKENDCSHEMAARRREFLPREIGANLSHVPQYSFEPAILPGNIENFIGNRPVKEEETCHAEPPAR